ncbi:hypothetical protein A11A3_09570 [Alcanivorax hongdengensis A-11-3]|uniref:Uncharacterized protein n=1 Tax=Alcanivorax hongdengensis A-11-3 TaxID=1177179 RepID=L0WBT0_9GAMM|nr:periplasmic heavy metal sensor [Alcanivorax hongdengensis]EKF74238.1 hypothetical protein A11A3_09570 [Alcanivorax hongdengensis A-11-3]
MKKVLIATLLVASSAVMAAPAPDDMPPPHEGRMMEHMSKKLELTDQQQAQIQAIFKAQGEKMKALHTETESKINGVLNAEQQKKFAEMKEKRKARMEKWREKHQKRMQDHGDD